jgi:hypothetical protein
MNRSDLMYLASGVLAIGIWACALGALYVAIEGAHWVYCKIRGRDY